MWNVIKVCFSLWIYFNFSFIHRVDANVGGTFREDTATSGGPFCELQNRGIRGRVPNVPTLQTSQAAAGGGGVASFCCSGEIWHGAERGGGREWDSPIGINGSSEVWTERRGEKTWGWGAMTENTTVRAWRLFPFPVFVLAHKHGRRGPIRGSFDSEHNRRPLQTGAPAF